MIAVGAGMPPHFLSDPEGATQATAREANEPTYRFLKARQDAFVGMLGDIVTVAVMRAQEGRHVASRPAVKQVEDLKLTWVTTDLNAEDNFNLARSGQAAVDALQKMKAEGWVEDADASALAFKFLGELREGGKDASEA
jgi:hypothetical protein